MFQLVASHSWFKLKSCVITQKKEEYIGEGSDGRINEEEQKRNTYKRKEKEMIK